MIAPVICDFSFMYGISNCILWEEIKIHDFTLFISLCKQLIFMSMSWIEPSIGTILWSVSYWIFFIYSFPIFPGGCVPTGVFQFLVCRPDANVSLWVKKHVRENGKPTGIFFLSANWQANLIFPVKLCLTAKPWRWTDRKNIPVGFSYFPVGSGPTG